GGGEGQVADRYPGDGEARPRSEREREGVLTEFVIRRHLPRRGDEMHLAAFGLALDLLSTHRRREQAAQQDPAEVAHVALESGLEEIDHWSLVIRHPDDQ